MSEMRRRCWQAYVFFCAAIGVAGGAGCSSNASGVISETTHDGGGTTGPDSGRKTNDGSVKGDATGTGGDGAAAACGATGPELCPAGGACKSGADCTSMACQGGACVSGSCTLGVKNGMETDVNCGGPQCGPCPTGDACALPRDCQSNTCTNGKCVAPACSPTCSTGNACGATTDCSTMLCTNAKCAAASCAPACVDGDVCGAATECASGVCAEGKCAPPSCSPACPDGNVCGATTDCESAICMNGTCGMPTCSPTCPDGNVCGAATDCGSGVCTDGKCAPPTCAPTCPDGNVCGATTDCASLVCTSSLCAPPSCSPTCADGNACGAATDCGSGVCTDGMCAPPSCSPACSDGNACGATTDCESLVCTAAVCTAPACSPTCLDGNVCGAATDCGSDVCTSGKCAPPACAPACVNATGCGANSDCASDICKAGACAPPACAPTCIDGNVCGASSDCGSGVCTNGKCVPPPCAPYCTNTTGCGAGSDCASDVCTNGACAPPACSPSCADDAHCALDTDCLSGICNVLTYTCVDALSCKGLITPAAIMDITSPAATNKDGDAVGKPNANGAAEHAGLDTCGLGESNDIAANKSHQSCCRSLLLPGSTTVRLDKYEVTAGRMRQFVESVNKQMLADPVHNPGGALYDLQDWATSQIAANTAIGKTLAASLSPAALALLPGNYYGKLNIVEATGGTVMDTGWPSQLQGCYTDTGAAGASTYWWPEDDADGNGIGLVQVGSPSRPYTQDYYDIKAMNCAPAYMYAAFCAWDGGYLPTNAQVQAAYGSGQYPWTTVAGSAAPFIPHPYVLYTTTPPAGSGHKIGDPDISSFLLTVNWDNDSWGGYPGLFYFWPNAGLSPAAASMNSSPPEIASGLDYSSFIASPGRFPLDATTATSASFGTHETWQDMGANMMEASAASNAAGGTTFCDCGASNTGEVSNCTCTDYKGTQLPGVSRGAVQSGGWIGGSWEGHYSGSPEGGPPYFAMVSYNFPIFTQYGKFGARCARNAEP